MRVPRLSTAWPCTVGPGLVGALLVGMAAAKSIASLATEAPLIGVNHLEGPHPRERRRTRAPSSPRGVPGRVRRSHDAGAHARAPSLRAPRADRRRRRGEAFRQDRPVPGARLPAAGLRSTGSRARATRTRSGSRARWPTRATSDFSLSGLKTAVLRHVKAGTAWRAATSTRPTWRRRSRRPSSTSRWRRAIRRGPRAPGRRRSCSAAAWWPTPRLRERMREGGRGGRAPRAVPVVGPVHGQRRDDRASPGPGGCCGRTRRPRRRRRSVAGARVTTILVTGAPGSSARTCATASSPRATASSRSTISRPGRIANLTGGARLRQRVHVLQHGRPRTALLTVQIIARIIVARHPAQACRRARWRTAPVRDAAIASSGL